MCYQTSSDDPECCSSSCLQRAQEGPRHSSVHLSALATTRCSHQVQGIDACLQIYHRLSSLLPSLTPTSLHPHQTPTINQQATSRGSITESHKITFQNILIHSSMLVERSPRPHPECRITGNIQKTAENPSLP